MRMVLIAGMAALALAGASHRALAVEAGPDGGVAISAEALRRLPKASAALSGTSKRPYLSTVKAARRAGYKSLSELTGGAYPAFTPGVGAVYARRETLPVGPFLAYDRKGRQVSTIYKFSLDKLADKQGFEAQGVRMPPVDHVGVHFSGSHPGVDFPHSSFVFWHVPKKDEARVAN